MKYLKIDKVRYCFIYLPPKRDMKFIVKDNNIVGKRNSLQKSKANLATQFQAREA